MEMAYSLLNGHMTDMTSRDPQRCCDAVRSAILATTWLLVGYTSRKVVTLVYGPT